MTNPASGSSSLDSPTVVAANADEWIGRGWGDFEPTPDPLQVDLWTVRRPCMPAPFDGTPADPSAARGPIVLAAEGLTKVFAATSCWTAWTSLFAQGRFTQSLARTEPASRR